MTSDRIEIHPKVMLGKPMIRGTRIPLELLVAKLRDGTTQEDLLDAYPRLTQADIEAAIRYASFSIAEQPTTDQSVDRKRSLRTPTPLSYPTRTNC